MAEETKTGKVTKYRVKARIAYKYPEMVTLVPVDLTQKVGVANPAVVSISLGTKEVRRTLPATADRPAMEMVSAVATQEQLAYLYNIEQHPHIEAYQE